MFGERYLSMSLIVAAKAPQLPHMLWSLIRLMSNDPPQGALMPPVH